jgi:hypothetical protein
VSAVVRAVARVFRPGEIALVWTDGVPEPLPHDPGDILVTAYSGHGVRATVGSGEQVDRLVAARPSASGVAVGKDLPASGATR